MDVARDNNMFKNIKKEIIMKNSEKGNSNIQAKSSPGKEMTWDEYVHSQQETYLDEENGADTEIVYENSNIIIYAFKALKVNEEHYFQGKDEDFAIVGNHADLEWLVWGCTLADLIEYYSDEDDDV